MLLETESFEEGCGLGDEDRNLSAGFCRADESERRANASGTFAHSLQPEVAFFPLICYRLIDAYSVVLYPEDQVSRIDEFYLQSAGARVGIGIANRFIPDPVDLVANDRVHFSGNAGYGKGNLHGALGEAIFCCSP